MWNRNQRSSRSSNESRFSGRGERDRDRGRENFGRGSSSQGYSPQGNYSSHSGAGYDWNDESSAMGSEYGGNYPQSGFRQEETGFQSGSRQPGHYGRQYGSYGDYGTQGGYGRSYQQQGGSGEYGSSYGQQERRFGQGQSGMSGSSYGGYYGSGGYGRQGSGGMSRNQWPSQQGWSSQQEGQFQQQEEGGYGSESRYEPEFGRGRGRYYGRAPQGYTRSDERIREDIAEQIMRRGEFDPTEVRIEVKNGEVTLEGTIDSRQSKFRIEEVAEDVLGVKDVTNNLKIRKAGESGASERPGSSSRETEEGSSTTGSSSSGSRQNISSISGGRSGTSSSRSGSSSNK